MNFHFIDCEDVLRTPGRCEREKVKRGCLSGVMRKYCAKTCRVCGKLKRFVVYFDDIIRDSFAVVTQLSVYSGQAGFKDTQEPL